MAEPITFTMDCAGVEDADLGPAIKQPLIAMAKDEAASTGVELLGDPEWESFRDDDGKRYAIKLIWPTKGDAA